MERSKLWKTTLLSTLYIALTLIGCWIVFEFCMELMTKQSTLSFFSGIALLVLDVVVFFLMMDFQVYKIQRAFKKKNDTPKAEESDKADENK